MTLNPPKVGDRYRAPDGALVTVQAVITPDDLPIVCYLEDGKTCRQHLDAFLYWNQHPYLAVVAEQLADSKALRDRAR